MKWRERFVKRFMWRARGGRAGAGGYHEDAQQSTCDFDWEAAKPQLRISAGFVAGAKGI